MKHTMTFLEAFPDYLNWNHLALSVVSGITCMVLIALVPYFPRLTGSPAIMSAVQAFHLRPTPRVGGIAIFSALAVGAVFAPADPSFDYGKFMLAAGLLFTVGLVEDLGFGVSPMKRLLAALLASLLVILLLGFWLARGGAPYLDALLEYWIVGVPVTMLVTAAIANAFNMIDGVNGLAAVTAIIASAAMAAISFQAGYDSMVVLTTLLGASVLGFMVFNFPFGKIFLGDAGAYTLGFVLAWFAIAIMVTVPQATPWALLLTLFWPVADCCLAVYRRWFRKADSMQPDRLHVHQLVMRALEIYVLGQGKRRLANPMSTVVLVPLVASPAIVGVLLWDQPRAAFFAVLVFGLLFFSAYVLSFPLLRKMKRKHACPYPVHLKGMERYPGE